MSLYEFVQRASQEFEQKMLELGRNWDTEQLTGELALQARTALVESFGHASRTAYQAFLESYDRPEPQIEHQGQTLRYKLVSPKTFLTSFGPIALDRRLYQADAGGPSYVPLDQRWDMDGHFAVEEVRQAVCYAMAHLTAGEAEQLLRLGSLFQPSATAIQHIVDKVSAEIEPSREALDTTIRAGVETPAETKVLVASMDGTNVLLREPGVRRGRPQERPRGQPPEPKNASYRNAMVGTISFYGTVPAGGRRARTVAQPVYGPDAPSRGRHVQTGFRAAVGVDRNAVGPAGTQGVAVRRSADFVELSGPPGAVRGLRETGGLLPYRRASLARRRSPVRQKERAGPTLVREVSPRAAGTRRRRACGAAVPRLLRPPPPSVGGTPPSPGPRNGSSSAATTTGWPTPRFADAGSPSAADRSRRPARAWSERVCVAAGCVGPAREASGSSTSAAMPSRDYGRSSGKPTNSFAVPRERYVKWKLHPLRNAISHKLPDSALSTKLNPPLKAFFEDEFDQIPDDLYSKSKALRKGIIFHCAMLPWVHRRNERNEESSGR